MAAPKSDAYLAQPSGACCLQGHLHTGTPRGEFHTIANITTYVTRPPPGKANGHIVLYFPDVFGLFTNGQLVMDGFADAGYLTAGLDYFRGDPVTLHRTNNEWSDSTQTFEQWLAKHVAFADAHVPAWIADVKATFGTRETKYVCTGYCFGAPYVCESLAADSASASDGKPACSAGAFAHPAFLKEQHFRNVQAPLFLSCAETDFTFGDEDRNRAVAMLREDGKLYQLQLFAGVKHGFALRCNLDDPYERMVKERSLEGMVGWFDFWLGAGGARESGRRTGNL